MKWNAIRRGLVAAVWLVVMAASAQEERTVSDNVNDEDALVAVVSGDAAWAEKQAACRSLRRIGTEKSVPALAKLLTDKELAHMARFALEAMPYPEAGRALRDALSSTTGPTKIGIIASLGARRDAEAVPQLVPTLRDGNLDMARTAAAALGRIATERAVSSLKDAFASVPPRYKPPIEEALLTAGQLLVAEGRGAEAVPVYEALLNAATAEHVRLGAFRGIVHAQPQMAPERILAALRGDDVRMRNMAGQLVAETVSADATRAYADALPTLSAETQAVLLRGLGDRGDGAARPAVLEAVKSPEKAVQVAALRALTRLGVGEDVAMLAGLMTSNDGAVAGAAKDTLANMRGEDVDSAIVALLPDVDASVRGSLLTLLAGRGADGAVAAALEYIDDEPADVRIASLAILGQLGTGESASAILDVVTSTDDTDVFTAASTALGALAEREADAVTGALLGAKDAAEGEAQIAILRALGRAATPKALESVVKAMGDEALNDEAVKILSNWPTTDAAPHLLKLAKSADAGMKDVGLRGYVRLVGLEGSADKKVEMLTAVAKLTKTPQEKWIVLSAWGQVPTTRTIDVLLPQLKDESVQIEAAAAVIAVATELGKDEKTRAKATKALQAVVDTVKDEAVRARAEEALGKMGGQ